MSARPRPYDDATPTPLSGVTSVGLAMPVDFTVTNSPVTSSGVINAAWNSQAANLVMASPAAGPGVPTFRALANADIPAPTLTALGGVRAINAVAHRYLTWLSTAGLFAQAQPATTDLSDFVAPTTFQPTVSCLTPGNLSVAYTQQTGSYVKIGPITFWTIYIQFTPTFSTAAGQVFLNVPIWTNTQGNYLWAPVVDSFGFSYPSGCTMLGIQYTNANQLSLWAGGSSAANQGVVITNFTSGTAAAFGTSGFVF